MFVGMSSEKKERKKEEDEEKVRVGCVECLSKTKKEIN